ncbi:universal stress protein [Myxococcota bacterium]|nr:universal stress protein [Myxococcota bacterium]
MTTPAGIQRILVPVDLGPGSDRVFAHALKLALCTGARLSAVHVALDPDKLAPWTRLPGALDLLLRWGVLPAGATEAEVEALGLHVDRDARVDADTEQSIVGAVIETLPNILVVGTSARTGLERLRHGSVAEAVARRSGAVTLFLPQAAPGFVDMDTGSADIRTVIFPVGGPAGGLQHAVDVLGAFLDVLDVSSTRVVLVHVGDESQPELEVAAREGWQWSLDRRQGDVVEGVLAAVEQLRPELVVMATRGHDSLLDALRGSKTELVLRRAGCAVLAVPVD